MSDVDPGTLPQPERGIPDDVIDLTRVEPMTGMEPDAETAAERAETFAPPKGDPPPPPQ